jgi:hypothetical protein
MAAGDLVIGWLLLARRRGPHPLAGRRPGRRSTGQGRGRRGFFAGRCCRAAAERAIAEATDNDLMDLDEASF